MIDASVALKWFLRDEKYGDRAMGLLDRFVRGEFELAAPSLMFYEVINGLVIAQRKGRIAEERVLASISGFINLGIAFVDVTGLEARVLHFCGFMTAPPTMPVIWPWPNRNRLHLSRGMNVCTTAQKGKRNG